MIEEWRRAPGFPEYEVSDHGRVRRIKPASGTTVGRVLAFRADKDGYNVLALRVDGRYRSVRVGRLVATAFFGRPAEYEVVNHDDADKRNDHLANLYWTTKSGNQLHAEGLGLKRHPTKISDEAVRAIRASDESAALLAQRHEVSESLIQLVKRGKRRARVASSA